jgi:hypothetical protein
MKSLVAAGLALAAPAVLAAAADATVYSGRALVRTDAADRVAVVLDADRDGFADHVFLFDPLEGLPLGLAARECDVTVELRSEEARVSSSDGLVDLVLRVGNPPEATLPTVQVGGHVRAFGRALVHRVLGAESGTIGSIATDGMATVIPAGTDPREDPCLNPTSCRSGGKGSTACDVNCEGRTATVLGVGGGFSNSGCSVACNLTAGYYSCCNCDASGGNCGCYSGAPCLLDPKRPVIPQPQPK